MNKEELHKLIEKEQPNICQISCYKNGKELYHDEWNSFTKTDTCHVMSVTKSIVALLIGIALDKGYISDIEQPVLDFFPEYNIKRGEKKIQNITIKHLLTMSAPYKYKYEPWTKICSSDHWTFSTLDFLGGRKGNIGDFRYSTLGVHILTGILSRACATKPIDFANRYLFEPIGVAKHTNYYAETAEEHQHFTMGKKPKKNIWFCDTEGIATAGYGLCFSASDMAKIGQLCLHQGIYHHQQIVSSAWIDKITTPYHLCGDEFRNMSYGYLWWIIDENKHIYAAIGNSGNVIYVNPVTDIVVAISSYFKPTVFDRIDFIQNYIEPFLTHELYQDEYLMKSL